jgi:pimeloyl-ACP methyl ester carboxylesterase
MSRIADLGGREGLGRVKTPTADEPVFAQPWEGRAFALTLLSMGVSGRNLDAARHAMECLERAEYFDDGYRGRWLHAAELMLVESAILAPGAVDARAGKLRGEDVEEPPVPEPNNPDYAPTAAIAKAWTDPDYRERLLSDGTAAIAATQRPATLASGEEPSGPPAWTTIPSWYLIADRDKVIPPAAQRFMVERAHARTRTVNSFQWR